MTPEEIREKRYITINGLWKLFIDNGYLDKSRFKLSVPLMDEVIEHYLLDLGIVKTRYNISGEVQLHKVAGLMTACILRYRPIIPLVDKFENIKEIYANEFFAVLHGLAICGEYSLKTCEELAKEEWFDSWVNNFLFLLHRRNYTAEALAFVFETLSIFIFPANIKGVEK